MKPFTVAVTTSYSVTEIYRVQADDEDQALRIATTEDEDEAWDWDKAECTDRSALIVEDESDA